MEREQRPDCYRCRAFFVTHEPEHPYGCRTFGMKSRVLPSISVHTSSGQDCRAFEEKDGAPGPGRAREPRDGDLGWA